MDRRFADWYRLVDPDPQADMLHSRWGVIETLTKAPAGAALLDLIRLFTGLPQNHAPSAASFVQAFKDADAAFPMRNNDLLVRVLAGAALVELLSTPSTIGDVVALGLRAAHLHGNGHDGAFPEGLEASDLYLEDRARAVRHGTGAGETALADLIPSVTIPKPKDLTVMSGYTDTASANASFTAIADYATGVNKTLTGLRAMVQSLAEQVDTVVEERLAQVGAYKEEHNILWWLFSEYSRDLSKPARDVGLPAFAVIAGKELADLTVLVPGILSADGMLHRALQATQADMTQAITVSAAVNATPIEWRREFAAEDNTSALGELAPLHLAISASLADEPARWSTRFRSMARLKRDPRLPPSGIAEQMYTERMLARAVQALGS